MSLSLLSRPTLISQASYFASRPISPRLTKMYQSLDLAVALTFLFVAVMVTNLHRMPHGIDEFLAIRVTIKNFLLLGTFSLIWARVCVRAGLYDFKSINNRKTEVLRVMKAYTIGGLFALMFPLASVSGDLQYKAVAYFWLGTIFAGVPVRYLINFSFAASRQFKIRHVIIVGSGPRALRLYQEYCADPFSGYRLLGFVDSDGSFAHEEIKYRTLGTTDQLENILMNNVVDEVLIALPIKSCYADIQNTIRICEKVGVESKYLSDVFQSSLAKPRHEQAEQFSMVAMKLVHTDHSLIVKRIFDVVVALIGLIALLPIMLLTAIAIKLTSAGPIIFSQERYGLNKRRFKMYKFRTMIVNAEALQPSLESLNEARGPVFKMRDDPRLIGIGKFLRVMSIDELPQLINVLRGEMSLVGPRPLPVRDVSRFSEGWLMRRFSVRPGITCLWQINGRSNTDFERWIELDLKYIDEWSFGLDLKILFKTVPVVLKGTGAT